MFNNVNEMIQFIQNLKRNEHKKDLSYMQKLVAVFNNPHQSLPFIHIGGTNGKGSVIAILRSIFLESKLHVGTFTSPYVVCFNERITYDGNDISDDELLYYGTIIIERFDDILATVNRLPSFFEFLTLLSLLYFKDKKDLDVVLFEVGIGGLLDCTNIIDPLISAVTNVSYDHMAMLGHTLEAIWDNKLGIAKRNRVFITHENDAFKTQIEQSILEKEALLKWVVSRDICNILVEQTHTKFDYKTLKALTVCLVGYHQAYNASLAIEIIENLKSHFTISEDMIRKGLKKAYWPGRMEIVNANPLILLDGAHNVGSIEALVDSIHILKNANKVRIIFAVSADKDKQGMISKLDRVADELVFTHFSYERSEDERKLIFLSNHNQKKQFDDLNDIFDYIFSFNTFMNVFCGSLYFVSEVREILKSYSKNTS